MKDTMKLYIYGPVLGRRTGEIIEVSKTEGRQILKDYGDYVAEIADTQIVDGSVVVQGVATNPVEAKV